jgi:hypothetical protein
MKLASTCPNSDMGVVWGLLCLHPNTIKPRYYYYSYYITSTVVGWCIVILRFIFTLLLLLLHPDCCRVMYCYFTFLFHYYYYSYYYITPTAIGWCIAILRFFFTIILIILILPHIFVRSISRRCLDQTLWNIVGISYVMWSCAFKCWFFQNGCRCNGNGQNAKILKNTKNDHSRLLAEQKLMKLDTSNIHI